MTTRLLQEYQAALLAGLWVTAELSVLSLLGSLLPGLVFVLMMRSRHHAWSACGHTLVAISRNIPSVVQLFMIYYLLPMGLNIQLSAFWSAIAAFVFNGAGYVAEILRSGLDGVPRGQWEAARALGIRGSRLYLRVILPQAAVLVVAPFMNEVTRQVKSSSLASTIAVQDLMYQVASASSATFAPVVFFSAAAALYFALIFPFGILARHIERRSFTPQRVG